MTRRTELLALLAWACVLFALCFSLGIRHNRFPYFYHPDEPGKCEQVLSGKFNFHHPMLLLETTRLASDLLHIPKKPQAIVQVGRCVSAGFVAAAIVAFSLIAFLWRGWRTAFITGAALALHHQLYEISHYLKEDSALLFGVGCSFLAAMAYSLRGSPWRAAILGLSCALAISGKYLGVVVLAVAIPVLWAGSTKAGFVGDSAQRRPGRGVHLALFAGVLAVVFAIINLPLLFDLVTFSKSFHREVDLVVSGQGDTTRSIPHWLYWNVFIDNTTPVIWVLMIACLSAKWTRWSTVPLVQKLLLVFPFAYAVALSFSPKENDRYFVPATAVFTLIAALGV